MGIRLYINKCNQERFLAGKMWRVVPGVPSVIPCNQASYNGDCMSRIARSVQLPARCQVVNGKST